MRRFLLACAFAAAACSNSGGPTPIPPSAPTPIEPSAPSPPPVPSLQPDTLVVKTFKVSGSTWDTHYNWLPDVRVDVIDGPMAGTIVHTGATGGFAFDQLFTEEATLRFWLPGYQTTTVRIPRPTNANVSGGPRAHIIVELPTSDPSPDISGAYTFTVSSGPSCDGPEDLRTRWYDVTLSQHTNAHSFRMNFADPNVKDVWKPTIEIRLKGSGMYMVVGDYMSGLIEDLPSSWITFFGTATATFTQSGFSDVLDQSGWYTFCPGVRPTKGANFTNWNCLNPQHCGNMRYSLQRR